MLEVKIAPLYRFIVDIGSLSVTDAVMRPDRLTGGAAYDRNGM